MKDRLNFLIKVFGIFLVFFILLKPVFMLRHLNLYVQTPISEWFNIIYNGLNSPIYNNIMQGLHKLKYAEGVFNNCKSLL